APGSLGYGGTFEVKVDVPAEQVDSVVLVRRTAITHLVDGGQRAVVLPVVARQGKTLTVAAPPNSAVAPAGPYMLFVNRTTAAGKVPSVSVGVTVGGGVGAVAAAAGAESSTAEAAADGGAAPSAARPAVDLDSAGAVPVEAELAFHEIAEVSGIPHGHGAHGHTAGDVAWRWLPVVAALVVVANVGPRLRRLRRGEGAG
ncbi:MAG TPA: galactose oxidase early set domain-containing protein, partial [Acidimicrobiales bacterium]|nr:galactose oxidase early set domain-containing protein [Acidimicrobiales bacterium]